MIKKELNIYNKLDNILLDVLENIDRELKNFGEKVNERVFRKFYELFNKESYIEKLNYNDLIKSYKDKNIHKYLFYMFESLLNKIILTKNINYVDFLFLILRYITYLWVFLSKDDKLVLIFYYYFKFVDLLISLKFIKCSFLINLYNIFIYFCIKDKKRIIFSTKTLNEKEVSVYIKEVILELNKIIINENINFIKSFEKEDFIDFQNNVLEKIHKINSTKIEDVSNINDYNLYNYIWICYYEDDNSLGEKKGDNEKQQNKKIKNESEKNFSLILKHENCRNTRNILGLNFFSINNSYNMFLNFIKNLFKITFSDFNMFFFFLNLLNLELFFIYFHIFEIMFYIKTVDNEKEETKRTKITLLSNSTNNCSSPILTEKNNRLKNKIDNISECIFLNNKNKKILWSFMFDELRKKFVADTKNVNYTLKVLKFTFSFFLFEENFYLKNKQSENYIKKKEYNFSFISPIYLSELLKFCLSFLSNLMNSRNLDDEVIFKATSYLFYLLSKLICNINNNIKRFILLNNDNNLSFIYIISYIHKYFKKLYIDKNTEEILQSKKSENGSTYKLKYSFITLERLYKKIQECLYIVLTIDDFIEKHLKKYIDINNNPSNNYDLYVCVIIKINKINVFYSNLDIIKILSEKDKSVFRKYIYTINKNHENFISMFSSILNIDYKENENELILKKYILDLKKKKKYKSKKLIKLMKPYHSPLKYIILKNEINKSDTKRNSLKMNKKKTNEQLYNNLEKESNYKEVNDSNDGDSITDENDYENTDGNDYENTDENDDENTDENDDEDTDENDNEDTEENDDNKRDAFNYENKEYLKMKKTKMNTGKIKKKDMPIFENSIFYINKNFKKGNIDLKNFCHNIILSVKRCILISESILNYFKKSDEYEVHFNIFICKNIFVNFLKISLLNISFFSYICSKLKYDDVLKQIYDSNLIILAYNIFDKYVSFVMEQDIDKLNKYKNNFNFFFKNLNKKEKISNKSNEKSSFYCHLYLDDIYEILSDKEHKNNFFLSDKNEFIETLYLNTFLFIINIISVWEIYLEIPLEVLNKMKYTFFELFYNTTIKIIKFIKKDKSFFFLLNILKFIYTKFISLPFNPININTTIKLYGFYEFLINDNYIDIKKEDNFNNDNNDNNYLNSISPIKFLNNNIGETNDRNKDMSNFNNGNVLSINKKKRVSMGGLIPVFLNNENVKKRKTNIDYISYNILDKEHFSNSTRKKDFICNDDILKNIKENRNIKYNFDENVNETPKYNNITNLASKDEVDEDNKNKDINKFRNTYLSNYYIPHIDLLFIIIDLEVFYYFEKKNYKKIIVIVENILNKIISKCDYNTKEYLRSSISYIYNYYQQIYITNNKINIQSCTVIRHIFNLYVKSKVFYLSKKIKKFMLYYKNNYTNNDLLKSNYNKIYNNLLNDNKWKYFFYFNKVVSINQDKKRKEKKKKIIDNLLAIHINTLLFLIFYEYLSKYITKNFIFFFRFLLFLFNKLCIDILKLVNKSNHLEFFNIFDFINNYNEEQGEIMQQLKRKLCNNNKLMNENELIYPKENIKKIKKSMNKQVIIIDIEELLVTYIQINFIFCRSCCFFIFFKNVCSQKYEIILKENITHNYFEKFKNNRDFFDFFDFKKEEKKSNEKIDDENVKNETLENMDDITDKKLNDSYDENSIEKYENDSSSLNASQSSFTLIEYTDYSNNLDYVFLEFILEKIEEMDVDYYYKNILKNCYYVIKIETFYNYIYNNTETLKRFLYLNNVYYLYKLYYHIFVWNNELCQKKDIITKTQINNNLYPNNNIYNNIFDMFTLNNILREKLNTNYIRLRDYDNYFFDANTDHMNSQNLQTQYNNEDIINNVKNNSLCKYNSRENDYFLCNIYNFKLKLFHPLNMENNLNKEKKNIYNSLLIINKNYLINLKVKYNKMKKYINNYMLCIYYIVLFFYFNEYIEKNKLSFYYIIYTFQKEYDIFNINFYNISFNEKRKSREKKNFYSFKIYEQNDLKRNIFLIFEILNNIYDIYYNNTFEKEHLFNEVVLKIDIKIIGYLSEIYKIAFLYKMFYHCIHILLLCIIFTSKFWSIFIFNEKYEYKNICKNLNENNKEKENKKTEKNSDEESKMDKNEETYKNSVNSKEKNKYVFINDIKNKKEKYKFNKKYKQSKQRRIYILNIIYNKITSNVNENNIKNIYNELHNFMQTIIICVSIFYLAFMCFEKVCKNKFNILFLNCANIIYYYYLDFFEYIQKFCEKYCADKLYLSNFFFDTFHLDLINLKFQAHVKAKIYKMELEKEKKINNTVNKKVIRKNINGDKHSKNKMIIQAEDNHKKVNNSDNDDIDENNFIYLYNYSEQIQLNFSYLFYYNEKVFKECIYILKKIEKKYENDHKSFFKNNICLYFNIIKYLYKKKTKYLSLLLFVNTYMIPIVTFMKFTMVKYFSYFNISSDFFSLKFEHPLYEFDIDMITKIKKTDDEKENLKMNNKVILMNLENLFCNMFLNKDIFYYIKFINLYYKKISKILYKVNNFLLSYYYLKKNILFICNLIYFPEIIHNYFLLTNIILTCGKERIELLTQEEIFFENLNDDLGIYEKKKIENNEETTNKQKIKDIDDFKIYEDEDFLNINYEETPLNTYLTKRHIYEYKNLLNKFFDYLNLIIKNIDDMNILTTKYKKEILYIYCLIIFKKKQSHNFHSSTKNIQHKEESPTCETNKKICKKNKNVTPNFKCKINLHEKIESVDNMILKDEINLKNNNLNETNQHTIFDIKNGNYDKINKFQNEKWTDEINYFDKSFLTCFNNCNKKKKKVFFNFFFENLFLINNVDTDIFNISIDNEEETTNIIKTHILNDINNIKIINYNNEWCKNNFKASSENLDENEANKKANIIENEFYDFNNLNLCIGTFKLIDISVLNYLYLNYNFKDNLIYVRNYVNNRLFTYNFRRMNSYFVKILLYYITLLFLNIKNIFCDDCIYTIKKQQFLNSSANDCSRNIFFLLFFKIFNFFNFTKETLIEICSNYFPGNKYHKYLEILLKNNEQKDDTIKIKNIFNENSLHKRNSENVSNYLSDFNENTSNDYDKTLFLNFVEIFLFPSRECSYFEVLTICYEFLTNIKETKSKDIRKKKKKKMYDILKYIIIKEENYKTNYYFQTILIYLSLLLYNTLKKSFIYEMRKIAQFFLDFVFFFIENIKNNLIILQIIESYANNLYNFNENKNNNTFFIKKKKYFYLLKVYFRKLLSLFYLYTDELILYTIKSNIDQEISQKNYYRKNFNKNLNIGIICNYEYINQMDLSNLCFYWDYSIVSMSHDRSDLYIARCIKNFLLLLIKLFKENNIDKEISLSIENEVDKEIFLNEEENLNKENCYYYYEKIFNFFNILNNKQMLEKMFNVDDIHLIKDNIMDSLNDNKHNLKDSINDKKVFEDSDYNTDFYKKNIYLNNESLHEEKEDYENIIKKNKICDSSYMYRENDEKKSESNIVHYNFNLEKNMNKERLNNMNEENIFFHFNSKIIYDDKNKIKEKSEANLDVLYFFSSLYKDANNCINKKKYEYFHVDKIHLNIEKYTYKEKWNYIKKLERILKQYQHMIKIMCEILHESKNVDKNRSNLKMFIDLWWNNRYTLEQHLKILNLDISNNLGFSIHKLISIPLIILNTKKKNFINENNNNSNDISKKKFITNEENDKNVNTYIFDTISPANNQKYYLKSNFDIFVALFYYSNMLNIISWINKWKNFFLSVKYWDELNFINILLNLTVFSIVIKNCNVQIIQVKKKYLKFNYNIKKENNNNNNNNMTVKNNSLDINKTATCYLPFFNKDIETILTLEKKIEKKKGRRHTYSENLNLQENNDQIDTTNKSSYEIKEKQNNLNKNYTNPLEEDKNETISNIEQYRIITPELKENTYLCDIDNNIKNIRKTTNVINDLNNSDIYDKHVDISEKKKKKKNDKRLNSTIYEYLSPMKVDDSGNSKNKNDNDFLKNKRKRVTIAGTLNLNEIRKDREKKENNYLKYLDLKKICDKGILKCSFLKLRMYLYNILIDIFENNQIHPKEIFNIFNNITHSFITDIIKCNILVDESDKEKYIYVRNIKSKNIRKNPLIIYIHNNLNRLPFENLEPLKDSYIVRGIQKSVTSYLYERLLRKIKKEEVQNNDNLFSNSNDSEFTDKKCKEDNGSDDFDMNEYIKQEYCKKWKFPICKDGEEAKFIYSYDLCDSIKFKEKKRVIEANTNENDVSKINNLQYLKNKNNSISKNKSNIFYKLLDYDEKNNSKNNDTINHDNDNHIKVVDDKNKFYQLKTDNQNYNHTQLTHYMIYDNNEKKQKKKNNKLNIHDTYNGSKYSSSTDLENKKEPKNNNIYNLIITNDEKENIKDKKGIYEKEKNGKKSRKSICIEYSFINPFNNKNKKKSNNLSFNERGFNNEDKLSKKNENFVYNNLKKVEKRELRAHNLRRISLKSSYPSSSSSSLSSVELIQKEDELRKIFMNARKSMNIHNIMSIYKKNSSNFCNFEKKKRKKSVSESEAYFDEEKKLINPLIELCKKEKRRSYSTDVEHLSKPSKIKYIKYIPYYISSNRLIDPKKSKIFFVINPNGDLKRTEDATYPFIYFKNKEKYKYKNWNGFFGKIPCENVLLKHLCNDDLYLYCGHQGGEQYLKKENVQNAFLSYDKDLKKNKNKEKGDLKTIKNNEIEISKYKKERKYDFLSESNNEKRRNSCKFDIKRAIIEKKSKRKSLGNLGDISNVNNLYSKSEISDSSLILNKNDGINCCVFLIGCSSGLVSSHGFDLDVWGTPYDYIVGGCIFIFGNLWNVTDGEVDGFTQNFFWKWTQPNSSSLFHSNYNYINNYNTKMNILKINLNSFINLLKKNDQREKEDLQINNFEKSNLLIDVGDNFVTIDIDTYIYLKKSNFLYEYFKNCYDCEVILNKNLFKMNQNKKYVWLSMTEALVEARQFCRLPYTTGSAVVIYGLPL
ncbi:peptidase family C50, putative [Plasmodium gallinaceum]|uniref:separase n=1 Tax=Plasmodium gallinaceum TaxID=5849 RepID=A0A1J1GZP8_PLAGA|nr:peptidase family C50, putative [Plasmodium gallinaceum]CRG97689.1 peptidase family C50, putative [Plasmodium gallinaceum]